ncbi:MAG: hypothetical protein LBG60_04985 [Bifidobacteriaceae bacterium]|nr:hypothetical protein [Bifidobacteriaceae bacterium]
MAIAIAEVIICPQKKLMNLPASFSAKNGLVHSRRGEIFLDYSRLLSRCEFHVEVVCEMDIVCELVRPVDRLFREVGRKPIVRVNWLFGVEAVDSAGEAALVGGAGLVQASGLISDATLKISPPTRLAKPAVVVEPREGWIAGDIDFGQTAVSDGGQLAAFPNPGIGLADAQLVVGWKLDANILERRQAAEAVAADPSARDGRQLVADAPQLASVVEGVDLPKGRVPVGGEQVVAALGVTRPPVGVNRIFPVGERIGLHG